jgi:hypothetical protein
MITVAVASVAPVARNKARRTKTVTTDGAVATSLATLNRLSSLTNSHTSHKSHRSRTDYGNPLVDSHSTVSEGVARSISSSIVVRVERVASPQCNQGLGSDHHGFRVGQRGYSATRAEHSRQSRAPP